MFLNRKLNGVYLVFRTTLGEYSLSCTELTFTTPARSAPPPSFLLDAALITRMMFFCYFSNNRDYPLFKKRLPWKLSFFHSNKHRKGQLDRKCSMKYLFHRFLVHFRHFGRHANLLQADHPETRVRMILCILHKPFQPRHRNRRIR